MKYKIGDVVQCVDVEREEFGFKVGHTYTIMARDDGSVMLDNLEWWDTYGYPDDFKLVEETAMKKQFIDVEKYALENEISLNAAHEEIQTWLFMEGYEWEEYGTTVKFKDTRFLELNMDTSYCITWSDQEYDSDSYKCEEELTLTRQVTLVPFYNKIDKTEYVEFNGKQYNKAKLEEALKLIEQSS